LIGKDPGAELSTYSESDKSFVLEGYKEDIRPIVQKSAVYVVPIRIGGGTRLKILDAMAMGKAVVSTTIGCEGIDVDDSENICIADSPDEFAAKTVMLIKNENMRQKIGQNARLLIENKYTWKRIAPKLMGTYESACR
jgi:glycosyltransferase involved in cell wall biosynthesis